jgi:thiosulfate/3-mercaptopyruvate sulfurtransferase
MLGIVVVFLICFLCEVRAQEVRGYTVLSAAELKRIQDSGKELLVIDTLAYSTYSQGHIPGAKNFVFPNINMDSWDKSKTAGRSKDDFVAFLGENKDNPLVFYCSDEK